MIPLDSQRPQNLVLPPPVDPTLLPQEPEPVVAAKTSCPAPDPSVELLDGSRTVEVTALFHDSVLQVRHLADSEHGRVTPLTFGIAAAGWAAFLGGAIAALAGQFGLATLLLPLGLGVGVYAHSRVKSDRQSPHFSLGEASESDLHLAHPAIPTPCFPLVETQQDGTRTLNFTAGMAGDVTVGADRISLETLISSGQALPDRATGSYSFPIPHDARIKVDIGDNTFLVSSVAPAKRVPGSGLDRVDWSRQTFNGVSLGVHAVVLFLVFLVPPDPASLSLDKFNLDNERVRTRLVPVKLPFDNTKFLEKPTAKHDEGRDGARHKGESGKAGDKKSKQKNRRLAIPGNAKNPKLARKLAEQEIKRLNIAGIFGGRRGSKYASIFSSSDDVLGTEAREALGNLIADQVGDAYGAGGWGPIGTGRGGGGDNVRGSDFIGSGKLPTVGRGGRGKAGEGYGAKKGGLRQHEASNPVNTKGRVRVKGALSKAIIRRVVRRHLNQVRYCYQRELQSKPDLYGRIMVRFMIVGNGQVASSNVQSSTLNNVNVESCITGAVRRWLFPKPQGGGTVIVSYPFVLRAAGVASR
jgi:hypothetical protein